MWLERFSGQSNTSNTPSQPYSRPYSPNPRRPSLLAPQASSQRLGISPRSSSLSLVSNESTTSLLGDSKKSTSSNLKQSTAIIDYPDPLEVLQTFLGSETKGLEKHELSGHDLDLALEGELDFGGLTLQEFAEQGGPENGDVQSYVPQTLEECMYLYNHFSDRANASVTDERDRAHFEDLHRSIRACDDVLSSVEINLTNFQNDLGIVSAEIETLQARSTALSIRLENRKAVERGL